MSIYKDVTNKSWLSPDTTDDAVSRPAFAVPDQKVGLYIFLACASVLFSLLVISFFMRMHMGGGDWVAIGAPSLLWLNTGLLVISSVLFQISVNKARKGQSTVATLRRLFIAGGVFTLLFVAGQYLVWQQLGGQGQYITGNPANSFFYLLTGVHVLHLLGGLWVWSKTSFQLFRLSDPREAKLNLELCATYWHFLLAVWIGLFYLLATH